MGSWLLQKWNQTRLSQRLGSNLPPLSISECLSKQCIYKTKRNVPALHAFLLKQNVRNLTCQEQHPLVKQGKIIFIIGVIQTNTKFSNRFVFVLLSDGDPSTSFCHGVLLHKEITEHFQQQN